MKEEEENENKMEVSAEIIEELVQSVVNVFAPGELISHDYMKAKLMIVTPNMNEFQNGAMFIDAVNSLQFKYMSSIEIIRDRVLEDHNLYMNTVRGEGYCIIKPKEQVEFAFKKATKEIKAAMSTALKIMTHVRHNSIPAEQRSKDNDLLVKLSMFESMVKSLFKKA